MLNKENFLKIKNTLENFGTEIMSIPGMPGAPKEIYLRCPGCKKNFPAGELKKNLLVCDRCGCHLRMNARERIDLVADAGSFEEWDASLAATDFLEFPGYEQKLEDARKKSGEPDAVVTGRALVGGNPCVLFAMNSEFMMGSMGAVVGEKVTRAFERAAEERLPVVGFTVSGGARMQEGMISLMQMAKVSGAVKRHSDLGGLYIAVLTDPTSGGVTASFAMEADILLAEPGALIAFAGPRVIEQTIHAKLPPGFQRAEFLLKKGFLDRVVPRKYLKPYLRKLLSMHRREDGGYGRL